jgi:transcriptional regulator with GAF, ATPase, and Fis domain
MSDAPHETAGPDNDASIEAQLVAVYTMIRKLNSQGDPESMLESILDMALQVVRAERGMILLRDDDTGEFSVHLARNLENQTIADAGAFSSGIVAHAGAGKAVLSLDARNDSRFNELKSVSLYGIHALMCVPLRTHDKIVGAVYVDSKEDGLFTPDDLRFLEAFADHAALALANARKRVELVEDTERLQQEAAERAGRGNLIGNSPQMKQVFELIDKVAGSELPVLIHGESGTGKELVAQAIHYNGPRGKRTFVSENCAAIPDTLLQSELFGHVRGAFTGADRDRAGLFEQAHGGTLFLDEIGDMSPTMQAQILRALQEGEIRRVGGTTPISVDVRVIAATHRDLQQETAAGRFREDLLYRLQVLLIELPPLRERRGDVRRLTRYFLQRIAAERDKSIQGMDASMFERLERYSWPGNVRQLQNTLQRLSLLAGDGPIGVDLLVLDTGLRELLDNGDSGRAGVAVAPLSLSSSERDRIVEALRAAAGNRSRAARLLGVSRATIYRKIKELKL